MGQVDGVVAVSLLTNPFFQVGMGLLANSGPSLTPVNPWQGVQQGLLNARNAQIDEQELARKKQEWEWRQKEWQRKEEQRAYIDQMVSGLPSEMQGIARAFPEATAEVIAKNRLSPRSSERIGTADEFGITSLPADMPVKQKSDGQGGVAYEPIQIKNTDTRTANMKDFEAAQGDPAYAAWLQQNGGGQYAPAYQFIPTADGLVAGNIRTGGAAPVMVNGQPVIPAAADPSLQGEIAGRRKAEELTQGAQAQAAIDLPQAQATADQTVGLVKALRDHPGLSDVVGLPDPMTAGGLVPGSRGADFRARLEQLQGQQFLQAYQSLKGAGQISEAEGTKAQNAVARMQTAQSEREFKKAADEFISITEKAVERAQKKAGQSSGGWSIKLKGE